MRQLITCIYKLQSDLGMFFSNSVIDAEDDNLMTPLMLATKNEHEEVPHTLTHTHTHLHLATIIIVKRNNLLATCVMIV